MVLLEPLISTLKSSCTELNVEFVEQLLECQKYYNCGPEVIENFMLYLTGDRVDQESATAVHSILLMDNLMGVDAVN